jgi:hypothetical protein
MDLDYFDISKRKGKNHKVKIKQGKRIKEKVFDRSSGMDSRSDNNVIAVLETFYELDDPEHPYLDRSFMKDHLFEDNFEDKLEALVDYLNSQN